eukprot:179508_1
MSQQLTHSLQQQIDEDEEHNTQSKHQPNLMVISNQCGNKERKKLIKNVNEIYQIDLNLNDEWIKVKYYLKHIKLDVLGGLFNVILYILMVIMVNELYLIWCLFIVIYCIRLLYDGLSRIESMESQFQPNCIRRWYNLLRDISYSLWLSLIIINRLHIPIIIDFNVWCGILENSLQYSWIFPGFE